jgi:hypothetical protein
MIIITGDSHSIYNFRNLDVPHISIQPGSLTMHRVGRDKEILYFKDEYLHKENIFIMVYGEIDNRCHIHKQVLLGRDFQEVIHKLITEYMKTISKVITTYKAIIICAVVPPTNYEEYHKYNPPIVHEFPFVGTDEERIKYWKVLNAELKKQSEANGFFFLDYVDYYTNEDGMLNYALSDKRVHIEDNKHILEKLQKLLKVIYLDI